MTDHQKARETVSDLYAKAVSGGDSCCCGSPTPKGVAAQLSGYTDGELLSLPDQAVVNSFGCGNPLAFSDVREGDVVVDLGSGAGIDLLIAARKVGTTGRVIGVDMTDEMLNKAREVIEASGLQNVEVRKGLIEDLPLEPDSVDWVISNCVINLSPEKDRVFSEIARVLKRGGRIRVSDIIARDLPAAVRENLDLYCSCIAGAISDEAYGNGLTRAGLIDVEVRRENEFDEPQLKALIESDLNLHAEQAGDLTRLAESCVGKVWSAIISARKPE